MQLKLSIYTPLIIFYLTTTLGCNKSEIDTLQQDNNALTNNIHLLEKENSILKNDIDRLKNPPNELYSNALNYEKGLQISEARSEYRKLMKWYPESKEAKKAKIRLSDLEKENDKYTIFSNFKNVLNNKFAGSSKAKLLSLKLVDNDILISAKHRYCDYYDVIFIDVGVAGYRSSNIRELDFSKIILELHCDANRINRYYVYKSDFLRYLSTSINDPQFIALIESM